MANDLALPNDLDEFGPGFHPTLKFLTGTCKECEEDGIPQNTFFANTPIKDPVIIVIDWRYHAIQWQDGKKIRESFDPESPIYKGIEALRLARKEKYPSLVPRTGLSFLVYILEQGQFAIFFPSAPTQRPTMGDIAKVIKPLDQRDSPAAKAAPNTHIFKLGFERLTNAHKTTRPTVTPLDQLPEQFAGMDPGDKAIEKAIKMFKAPVNSVEEAKDDKGDR